MVDSWEDQDKNTETVLDKKKVSARKSEKPDNDEEVPTKKPKLVDVDSEDSDDDFAAQLLEGQSKYCL